MTTIFKVGDCGKTRDGDGYQVIAITDIHDSPIVIVHSPRNGGSPFVGVRNGDGSFRDDRPNGNDLMPPVSERTMFVNVYLNISTYRSAQWVLHGYGDATEARAEAGSNAIAIAHQITLPLLQVESAVATMGQGKCEPLLESLERIMFIANERATIPPVKIEMVRSVANAAIADYKARVMP